MWTLWLRAQSGLLVAKLAGRCRGARCLPLAILLVAAACAQPVGDTEGAFHPDGWDGAAEPPELFDPLEAGEEPPGGYREVVPRDAITPLYDPVFLPADRAGWPEDELVVGVVIDGEARAYPVGFLNRREIVVDMHRGIPTFVTW